MERSQVEFHFPANIKLHSNPLAEAWLEIRWNLTSPKENPDLQTDSYFKFALGAFSQGIKDIYGDIEDLPASHVPEELIPYVVRHRFRKAKGKWPLLQIGPGVATVNFVEYAKWEDFEQAALYLRKKLVDAYKGKELITASVALKYRDAETFAHSSNSVLTFLQANLNTVVKLPEYIPGGAGRTGYPSTTDMTFVYDLVFPKGKRVVRIATGNRQENLAEPTVSAPEEVVVWQLEVISSDEYAPAINDMNQFSSWLKDAHDVLHEWFFALIDGELRQKYERA